MYQIVHTENYLQLFYKLLFWGTSILQMFYLILKTKSLAITPQMIQLRFFATCLLDSQFLLTWGEQRTCIVGNIGMCRHRSCWYSCWWASFLVFFSFCRRLNMYSIQKLYSMYILYLYRRITEPSTCNCLFRHEIVPMLLNLRKFGKHLLRGNNCLWHF